MWRNSLTAAALILALLRPSIAQQNGAQRVHDQVAKIAIGGALTVRMADGRELHGHLSNIEQDSFALREADLNQTLTVAYADVARVTNGYGPKGFMGRRVNPRRRLLIGALVIGGLIALIVAAVASDDS